MCGSAIVQMLQSEIYVLPRPRPGAPAAATSLFTGCRSSGVATSHVSRGPGTPGWAAPSGAGPRRRSWALEAREAEGLPPGPSPKATARQTCGSPRGAWALQHLVKVNFIKVQRPTSLVSPPGAKKGRPAYYISQRALRKPAERRCIGKVCALRLPACSGRGGTTVPRRQRKGREQGGPRRCSRPSPVLLPRGKQTARGLRATRLWRRGRCGLQRLRRRRAGGGGERAEPRPGWPARPPHMCRGGGGL
ncbi:uncharacterized protein LOC143654570 [Tamandua tetradactyla]|uniref:uncharacterized protein LOC143654570 n=1 Tax=Tamandua tetradactyla TaxID=48850 RepID=UPI004054303F